ncbi:hypothetical protein BDV93DRAFT_164930 [Ceratobasidium sp. AG-I]|nr:hypothetical protein BDV93DRAFT_164930 [Ceratobasidium sp. AG-I]
MPVVINGKIDFSDPLQLGELAKPHSSTSVIRPIAIQSTRSKMLADILFRFYSVPMAPGPERPDIFFRLSCRPRQKWLEECDQVEARKGLRTKNPPSWLLAWADLAYETLLHAPLEGSDELFSWSVMEKLKGKSRVCQECLEDFWSRANQQKQFNEWAQGVRSVLKQRLDGLEHLYAL